MVDFLGSAANAEFDMPSRLEPNLNSGSVQEFNFLEERNRESAFGKIQLPTEEVSSAGSSHGSARLGSMSESGLTRFGSKLQVELSSGSNTLT